MSREFAEGLARNTSRFCSHERLQPNFARYQWTTEFHRLVMNFFRSFARSLQKPADDLLDWYERYLSRSPKKSVSRTKTIFDLRRSQSVERRQFSTYEDNFRLTRHSHGSTSPQINRNYCVSFLESIALCLFPIRFVFFSNWMKLCLNTRVLLL